MLRRAGLALACLATPAPALAQDCPTAEFLLNHTQSLDHLSLEFDRQGRMDPSIDGRNDFLRGADECELDRDRSSGGDYFSLNCEWNLPTSEAALRRFTDWSARLQRCFAGQLTLTENSYTNPEGTYRVRFELEGDWDEEGPDGTRSASLRLALIEADSEALYGRQWVAFSVEREGN